MSRATFVAHCGAQGELWSPAGEPFATAPIGGAYWLDGDWFPEVGPGAGCDFTTCTPLPPTLSVPLPREVRVIGRRPSPDGGADAPELTTLTPAPPYQLMLRLGRCSAAAEAFLFPLELK